MYRSFRWTLYRRNFYRRTFVFEISDICKDLYKSREKVKKKFLDLEWLEPLSSRQLHLVDYDAFINCATETTVTVNVKLLLFKSLDMDGVNYCGSMSFFM